MNNDGDIDNLKHVSSLLIQLQNVARQYVVAIAGIRSPDDGDVQGSGTIIEIGGDVLLVTAEHVITQTEQKGYNDVVRGKVYQGIAFSNGHEKTYSRVLTGFRKDQAIDIAYAHIPRPELPGSDRQACPERLIAQSASGVEEDLLFIYGFPGGGSQFLKTIGGIHSKTFSFAARSGTSKSSQFDPAIHFAIRYKPNQCIDTDGEKAELAIPAGGLSGTAVWNTRQMELGATWTPDDVRVVGIVQQWDQDGQCLIATRIEHILPFLRGGHERKGETQRSVN